MLFCTPAFALFFALLFVAYWALSSRWARLGLLALAGPYFVHATGQWLSPTTATAWLDFAHALGRSLTGANLYAWLARGASPFPAPPGLPPADPSYWVPGIVLLAATLAWRLGHDRGRVWMLVLASMYFYASWNKWLALLICVSAALDYFIARGLDALTLPAPRRLLVAFSLCANLGLLCYFKYANFFLQSLEDSLHAAGVHVSLPLLQVILPVGISFYTFEAINYTVDVYRRRVPAERNLANFLLFITFFPHLVAGPIVRARDFLPQIHRRKRWDWVRLELGVRYFLLGLLKKWVIADRMASFVDPVFACPSCRSSGAVWLAVIAYALQIYGDFSGYSDMALGTAHLLGYKLAQNFNMPYLAANVAEFWHRWHMSLSTWLRDYLFIPLGGSRCSRWRTCLNLLITMTLGGLWHGASWTFVVWGLLHGLLLVAHRYFRDFCTGRPRLDRLLGSGPGTVLRVSVTFFVVMLCWVFFRANATEMGGHRSAFQVAFRVLHRLLIPHAGLPAPSPAYGVWVTVALVALCHALAHTGLWKRLVVRLPAPALGFGYAAVIVLALVLAPGSDKVFIYFQF